MVGSQVHFFHPSRAACCSYSDLPPVPNLFRDLERDESTWTSFRDRGVRRNTRFRGHGSLSSVTPSFVDWSSNSSFLELREFEPTTSSDNPASMPQSKEMTTSGLEDNGGEYGGRDQEDYEWESEDGEGLLDDTGTTANDWVVPARSDRDDKLDHSKSAYFFRAPRWEDTYAFRRSKSKRGIIRSAPSTDDVSREISESSDAASWLSLITISRRCILRTTLLAEEGGMSIVPYTRDSVVFASGSVIPEDLLIEANELKLFLCRKPFYSRHVSCCCPLWKYLSSTKVYLGSSSSLTSYTPTSEKWDWDWSKRPPSCLPAERVAFLLAKINKTIGSDKLPSAPVLSNSVSASALARNVAGESGGEECVPETATCLSSISSNGRRREKKKVGTGSKSVISGVIPKVARRSSCLMYTKNSHLQVALTTITRPLDALDTLGDYTKESLDSRHAHQKLSIVWWGLPARVQGALGPLEGHATLASCRRPENRHSRQELCQKYQDLSIDTHDTYSGRCLIYSYRLGDVRGKTSPDIGLQGFPSSWLGPMIHILCAVIKQIFGNQSKM